MESLNEFATFLRLEGQEESTIKTNLKLIRRVLSECQPLDTVSVGKMVSALILEKKSITYIRQIISIIRYYGKYRDIISLQNYPYPKLRNKSSFIRSTMNDKEIEDFISLPFPYTLKGEFQKRWDMFSIFFTIQAYSGMRPIEVSHLTIDDLDFGSHVFKIRKTKTHTPREIPISSTIEPLLVTYVSHLLTHLLFPKRENRSQPISGSAWLENFKKRIQILGIKRINLTPYSLRHSFASRLINESSIYKVKTLMGHTKITTTEKYLHTNQQELRKVVNNDPLSQLNKSGKDILRDIFKLAQETTEKYNDKLYSTVEINEEGTEMIIKRKVRS